MTRAASDAEAEVAPRRADADQHRGGRSGERDDRQGVAGEGLASQHHEPTDDRGDDCDDGAGSEGVDHEVELEEPMDIADEIPRETGVSQRHAFHAWKCVSAAACRWGW